MVARDCAEDSCSDEVRVSRSTIDAADEELERSREGTRGANQRLRKWAR